MQVGGLRVQVALLREPVRGLGEQVGRLGVQVGRHNLLSDHIFRLTVSPALETALTDRQIGGHWTQLEPPDDLFERFWDRNRLIFV